MELADTLVAGFDVIDLMHLLTNRMVELLEADAAGLMLGSDRGLEVLAATSEPISHLEKLQVALSEGPCIDAYRSGYPVVVAHPDLIQARWPQFAEAAEEQEIRSVQALPMRLRDQVIGAMNLFRKVPEPFTDEDTQIAQALVHVATIGLLHERSMAEADTLNRQLQQALDSRVIIEQAKGKIAERINLAPDAAFDLLRLYARSHNFRLTEVARSVVEGIPLPGLFD